jgi:hypothetical protein
MMRLIQEVREEEPHCKDLAGTVLAKKNARLQLGTFYDKEKQSRPHDDVLTSHDSAEDTPVAAPKKVARVDGDGRGDAAETVDDLVYPYSKETLQYMSKGYYDDNERIDRDNAEAPDDMSSGGDYADYQDAEDGFEQNGAKAPVFQGNSQLGVADAAVVEQSTAGPASTASQ